MSLTDDRQERRSRREGRRRDGGGHISQLQWKQPRRLFPPLEIVSADQLEAIHNASLTVLEDIGMEITLSQARDVFAMAGAKIEGERVRIGREIITEAIRSAPSEFTLHARNPEHSIRIGGDWIAFCPVGGPPNCADLDRGRRPGTLEDSCNFMRLAQFFNCIHFAGSGSVDALDVKPSIRHLIVAREKVRLSDKVGFVSSLGSSRVHDGMEISRLARNISKEQFDREASCYTVVNTNSPLKLDSPMSNGIIQMAKRGQMVCVTPFTLAGAMAPVTIAGALAQQNAEALAGVALAQLVRPGAPVVYGGFTSNVDMKSGAPAFGTPEYMKACIVGGQLARRYGLPYRTSGTNAANAVDAQAAYESVFSLWGAIMGGGNQIIHAAGWMEGGLVASYEKYALDIDLLQMVEEFLKPLEVSEDALAIDAMREVGPGGHFFGASHTLARYTDAFYAPLISDWRNFQQWQSAGSPQASQKANTLWKQALAEYAPPPLDPAIAEAVGAFIARRIEEGGETADF
ncbi:MAG: trimethylamine methyltransferase family protein [Parvibaculaceae bacterium]